MEYKNQRWTNSCGAACLLCAAKELGINWIPQNNHYMLWNNRGGVPLQIDDVCETRLYQVTGLDAQPNWQLTNPLNNDPDQWGYSMPSKIVECAGMLGLVVRVIAYRTWSVRLLKCFYRDEVAALRRTGFLMESHHTSSVHTLQNRRGELRELKVLIRGIMMHYVMVRPDGSVMDPSDKGVMYDLIGQDRYIDEVKKDLDMRGTGLSILMRHS